MTVEIDNATLKDGEIIYFGCNTEVIENVLSVHITKNNRYLAITTKEYDGFNAIMVDIIKYNVHITNTSRW